MDSRISPIRDTVATTTQPRPTPRPYRVQFSEVLATGARGLVRGAENAMRVLPGGPLMSVAIRGGGAAGLGATSSTLGGPTMGTRSATGSASATSAEGPGGANATGTGGGPGGVSPEGGLEGTIAQSQEMNLYYLRIQEEVNAQNRTFSALSNVLKAEHDTVKTAIGNIR